MTPRSKPKTFLSLVAYADFKRLPGNLRRQMTVAIDDLARNSRPSNSKRLTLQNEEREIRRLRLGKWRILYLILQGRAIILGIRKRPPYDYQDIQELLKVIE